MDELRDLTSKSNSIDQVNADVSGGPIVIRLQQQQKRRTTNYTPEISALSVRIPDESESISFLASYFRYKPELH